MRNRSSPRATLKLRWSSTVNPSNETTMSSSSSIGLANSAAGRSRASVTMRHHPHGRPASRRATSGQVAQTRLEPVPTLSHRAGEAAGNDHDAADKQRAEEVQPDVRDLLAEVAAGKADNKRADYSAGKAGAT